MAQPFEQAVSIFEREGGTLRMSEALRAGISRRTLYAMHDQGVLTQLSRGVYRLSSLPELGAPDLLTICTRIPHGVICLISALAFHELTMQIPHEVDVALARGSSVPRIDYPPLHVYWFSNAAFTTGVETHVVDGRPLRVYSPEKTIADVFKYRNKLGLDVALEALKLWRSRPRAPIEQLLGHARVCRVESVMRPYLEATT